MLTAFSLNLTGRSFTSDYGQVDLRTAVGWQALDPNCLLRPKLLLLYKAMAYISQWKQTGELDSELNRIRMHDGIMHLDLRS